MALNAVAEHPVPPYGIRAAELALCLGALTLGISEFSAMGLLPQIASETTVSIPTAGLAISAYAVGVVVGAPVIALSFTNCPRRLLLVSLAVLIAAGNLATAMAPSFLGVTAARFVAGLPHGAYLGTAAMVAASLVAPNQRASAVARVILGLSIANVLGVPLATWIGQLASWRVVFGLVAVLGLTSAALVRRFLPVIGPSPAIGIRRELHAIIQPQVLLALGTAAVGFGGMFAIYSYITPTLTQVTRVADGAVPILLAVFGIGMILGSQLGGWLADKGVMRAIGLMLGLSTIAQFLFFFTPASLTAVTINIGVIGATSMGLAPALQTRLMDVAPDAQMLAASLNHSAFNLANALGAWLGGFIIAAGYGWTSTGLAGSVLTVAGLAVFAVSVTLQHRTRAACARA